MISERKKVKMLLFFEKKKLRNPYRKNEFEISKDFVITRS